MAISVSEKAVKRQFGDKLREIRNGKGYSQEEVALEAGLDLTTINEIEMGSRNPTLMSIYRIAKALGLKVKDIFPF